MAQEQLNGLSLGFKLTLQTSGQAMSQGLRSLKNVKQRMGHMPDVVYVSPLLVTGTAEALTKAEKLTIHIN